ncbi:hypothetical protein FACS189445_1510 [Spirochaetia bacterium]|nr:hypothetical protein FACS189445_1510 [Spirochaetia bacterium]
MVRPQIPIQPRNTQGRAIANNDIVPGFDDEKNENPTIRLERVPEIDGALVLYLTGFIDTYSSSKFQKRVTKAIEAGFIRLIFHCGGLNYASSTGIGSFAAFLKGVTPKGGGMVLLEVQPKVYEVLQLLGFVQFFDIKKDLTDAVNFFRLGGRG